MPKPLLLILLLLTTLPAAEAEAPDPAAVDWPARIAAIAGQAPAYAPSGFDPATEAEWEREALQVYDAAGHTEEWAADCRALLVAAGRRFAGHPDAPDAESLLATARGLRARGCRDAMMRYVHGRALDWTGDSKAAATAMGQGVLAVANSPYSAERKFLFYFRLMQIGGRARVFSQGWVDFASKYLLESYREGAWVGAELELARLLDSSFRGKMRAAHVELCAQLLSQLRADDWARPAFQLVYHIEAAWNARGNGWASSVTEDGWKAFHHHLQQAYEAGLAGLQDQRSRGYCATRLLTVCLGHQEARARSLEWFAAALEADFNRSEAYNAMEYLLMDRWHGGAEAQLGMAQLLWATMRYDTLAVVEGVDQIWRLLLDLPEGQPELRLQVLAQEELNRSMHLALIGILGCANMSQYHRWANAWLSATHYAAGRLDEARVCFQAAGAEPCQGVFVTTLLLEWPTVAAQLEPAPAASAGAGAMP